MPDSVALCISTPVGKVFYTGDFKIDFTPIGCKPIDLGRIAELGNKGIKLLMCDSTNTERPGYTPSEKTIAASFDRIFYNLEKRVVIATFSSNVHRIQQIINASIKYNRKVAITGRSMLNVVKAASKLGYIDIPEGLIIDVTDMKRYNSSQLTLITTGSQGEPMSALLQMAWRTSHDFTRRQATLSFSLRRLFPEMKN
jgi:ribonuclease J